MTILIAFAFLASSSDTHVKKVDSPTFATMKKLLGKWSGEGEQHSKTMVEFSLVSNGRCVKESMEGGAMDTIFCDNGDAVVATHYCGAGNQPRYKSMAPSTDGKSLDFKFLDATGISSPDEGYMRDTRFQLTDTTHIVQEWTYVEKGKPAQTMNFHYVRS